MRAKIISILYVTAEWAHSSHLGLLTSGFRCLTSEFWLQNFNFCLLTSYLLPLTSEFWRRLRWRRVWCQGVRGSGGWWFWPKMFSHTKHEPTKTPNHKDICQPINISSNKNCFHKQFKACQIEWSTRLSKARLLQRRLTSSQHVPNPPINYSHILSERMDKMLRKCVWNIEIRQQKWRFC